MQFSGFQCIHEVRQLFPHNPIPDGFHYPQNKPHTHWQPLPVPPYPQPLTTPNLLFVSRDFPPLDVSYKWSQTIGDPFYWLISRRIPVVTSGLHPFDDCIISHCMDTLLLYRQPFTSQGLLCPLKARRLTRRGGADTRKDLGCAWCVWGFRPQWHPF